MASPRNPSKSDRSNRQQLVAAALAALFLLTACAGLTACGGASSEGPAESLTAASDAEWAWLQQAKKTLDDKRRQLAAAPAGPGTAALAKEVADLSEELDRRLVDFINATPLSEGEKPAGRFLAALRMKSDEDIRLAGQFIAQAGDYRRAIEIYEAALAVDPDNPQLKAALDDAVSHRYMTAERFQQVKKGMTQEEVRTLLGQPNLRDIRDFPERGVTAWFYTKDAEGRAAAVWFAKEDGAYNVYRTDFTAVDQLHAEPPPQPTPATPKVPA
jgi:outer membrane protein assembly factor BamE (lipoprotein component of BamABCDE complex)